MKKWTAWLLIAALLLGLTAGFAEEEIDDAYRVIEDEPLAFEDDGEEERGVITAIEMTVPELTEEGEDGKPFVPEGLDRAVFDGDGRTQPDPTKYPYCAIVYQKTTFTCGCQSTGTGFLVGRYDVVTAGHCLTCTKHGTDVKYMDMYFGLKNNRNYSYKYSVSGTTSRGNTWYNDNYNIQGDYGMIRIDKPLGDRFGWFGRKYLSDSNIEGQYCEVAGYRYGVLRRDSGFVNVLDSDHIKYRADTEPGNSGCPVFVRDSAGDFYAVAINIAENSRYNVGYRLTNLRTTLHNFFD